MKTRESRSLAGLLIAVAAHIAIVGAALTALGSSGLEGSLNQPRHQLSVTPQLPSAHLFQKISAFTDNVQHVTRRAIINELLDVARAGPLEASRPASADIAGSFSLPQQAAEARSGSKRKARSELSRARSKRKLDDASTSLAGTDPQGDAVLDENQTAKKGTIWPVWEESMEPKWGRFVNSEREKHDLRSDDNTLRGKAWRRVKARRVKAVNSGHVERSRRVRGSVGLSSDDLKQLDSADLGQALIMKGRMEMRVRRMQKDKPDQGSEQWETWTQNMQAEEDALAQVVDKVEKLKATRPAISMRPRRFVGLTAEELELFRSDDIFERNVLRGRLSARISKLRKGPSRRKSQKLWRMQRDADLAWHQALRLRKYYSTEHVESYAPGVLEAAAGMPSDEAAKQIPNLIKTMINKGKAAAAPEQSAASAANQHAGTSTGLPTDPATTAVGQLPAIRSNLPPWLRQALLESASHPSAASQHHLASGSAGASSSAIDVAAQQRAAGSSAQNVERLSEQEQHQQASQTAVFLDLFH